jgi:hypothetical protein
MPIEVSPSGIHCEFYQNNRASNVYEVQKARSKKRNPYTQQRSNAGQLVAHQRHSMHVVPRYNPSCNAARESLDEDASSVCNAHVTLRMPAWRGVVEESLELSSGSREREEMTKRQLLN